MLAPTEGLGGAALVGRVLQADRGLVFMLVWMLGLVLVTVVLVVGMESLQVVSLLDVLHLLLNTRVGGVVALRCRGGTVHGLPFVAFVLL
jgi:hypothetical protein